VAEGVDDRVPPLALDVLLADRAHEPGGVVSRSRRGDDVDVRAAQRMQRAPARGQNLRPGFLASRRGVDAGRRRRDDLPVAGALERRTLDELVAAAAARIERLEPAAALAAQHEGAVLVDLRSDTARERDGLVPGSLHVPRTVLEWRLDPASRWRSPHAPGLDARIVLLCDHGCSSVLAAATLADLGFARAADVVGGFAAWREAGLPVVQGPIRREPGALPGMSPPD
jgi:rhodanese-related sulfurtransferase